MFPNGVKIFKWPYEFVATEELVKQEMEKYGYSAYDLQTIPPWSKRSSHSHDFDEIRAAVSGCTTFHFESFPVTLEPGDILIIPAGTIHSLATHNGNPFTAFKGNSAGQRSVTEHGDGKGSVEDLEAQKK